MESKWENNHTTDLVEEFKIFFVVVKVKLPPEFVD